ncbi:hypothetical protein SAMN05444008_11757 [Cnuella takakiae]|uniref:Nucleotide-diphospho-sugar transferase domain-containing protein n=1 Tax=Cnuella takakiae TaxID=1302690 RepID=A0A1M5GU20_9BACT|nr:hypothetical protein [Cnuella takakiae]OLY90888.1 hypothetical protein BUE76_02500 [Cnuella takakiae]SHG07183.1 hypothetical protein SAMN05444008_11757 [Cnuella takakiae]
MHLLYLTFGKKFSVHLEVAFSIYSFLGQASVRSIHIITDTPEYYKHFQNKVRVLTIDNATLKDWEGPHQFFWRVKIKAIQQLCAEFAGEPVVYLDGDTFLYQPTTTLLQKLQAGQALMHENEGALATARTKTEQRMWQQVQGKSFAGFPLPQDAAMWNAGVVAVPNTTKGAECAFALQLCDELCDQGVTRRLVEQFSLSVALQRYYGLEPAAPFIAHYWSNKAAWDERINQFFTVGFFRHYDMQAMQEHMAQFDFTALPVKVIQKNTGLRLHRLVDKWFPNRETVFIEKGS